MKPQERDELAKQRELEAINARLAQHDRMVRLILILVIVLGGAVLGLLLYHL